MGTEKHSEHLADSEPSDSLAKLRTDIEHYRRSENRDGYRLASLYRQAAGFVHQPPELVREIICSLLIPDCILINRDEKRDAHSSTLRGILADWMDALEEDVLWKVRPQVLATAIESLKIYRTADALYTVTTVGYRGPDTVQALLDLAMSDAEPNDTALRLLAFTNETELRSLLSKRIHERLAAGKPSEELLHAIAVLGGEDAPETLFEAAKTTDDWFTFGRLSWLCDVAPGDVQLQDRIASTLIKLADALDDGWRKLALSGFALGKCRTPRILDIVAEKLPMLVPSNGLFHFDDKFKEVTRLVQLRRILDVEFNVDVSVLESAAAGNTGQTGRWTTEETGSKEGAWNTALLFGSPTIFDWVERGVSGESGLLQQQQLMELLSVFSLPTLPTRCVSLLADSELAFERNGGDDRIHPFLAAAKLASSQLTIEALHLLLNAGGLIDGSPLRTPVDAAASLASWLCRDGKTAEVFDAIASAVAGQSAMATNCFYRCLRRILADASDITLPEAFVSRVLATADDPSAKPHLRIDAIHILARCWGNNNIKLSERLIGLLDSDDSRLQIESAVMLATTAPNVANSVVLCDYWRRKRDAQKADTPRTIAEGSGYLLGHLVALWPETFADDCEAVLKDPTMVSAHRLIEGAVAQLNRGKAVPPTIVASLAGRLRQGESPSTASMHLIDALAELDVSVFVREPWHEFWDDWLPDSRAAIADAIAWRAEHFRDENKQFALEICTQLLGDAVFAVRRSAARGLASLDSGELEELCRKWVESGSIKARVRAAEALSWLSSDSHITLDNRWQRQLLNDVERTVRDAAKRSREDLQRREAATELFAVITEDVDADVNRWVLKHHAIGTALSRIGDDFNRRKLAACIRDRKLPPPLRHFLIGVGESLERQWKVTTSQWPEPWLPWRGYVEEKEGIVVVGDVTYECGFSLWRVLASSDDEGQTWGGSISPKKVPHSWAIEHLLSRSAEPIQIVIPDRRRAEAFLVHTGRAGAVITGTGPYPDPRQ